MVLSSLNSVFQNELRSGYLHNATSKLSVRPLSARENKLLLVQGCALDAEHYRQLGWQVESLVFAVGLTKDWPNAQTLHVVSPWASQWDIDGWKFHAVIICGFAGSVLCDIKKFKQLHALLEPNASLYFELENPSYYGSFFPNTTRELWPQDRDYAMSSWFDLAALKKHCEALKVSVVSQVENVDPLALHPDFNKWPDFKGFETKIELPFDLQARRELFVRSYKCEVKSPSHTVTESVGQAIQEASKTDLQKVHAEIESLLEETRLDEAGLLIDKLLRSAQGDGATCNLQGILQFYRAQYVQAWESFRLAILLQGDRLEYYQNLADVAHKADRAKETVEIVQRAIGVVQGVEEINIHG